MSKTEIDMNAALKEMKGNAEAAKKSVEGYSVALLDLREITEKAANAGPVTDEAIKKVEQMNEAVGETVEVMGKIKLPETAIEKTEQLANSFKNVGMAVAGVAQGLGGISQVFNDTLYKGIDDIYADYPALSDQYVAGVTKVADGIRPIFERLKNGSSSQGTGNVDTGFTGAGLGLDFGAAEDRGGIGLTGLDMDMGLSGGMGGEGMRDGEPTGIEAQRLRNQELLAEQQGFNVERLAMTKSHAEQDTALEKQSWGDKLSTVGKSAGAMANLMQNLYVMTGSKHRALFEAMKAFSIAETIIETFRSAQLSYRAFAGIPFVGPALGIAAAAAAMAAGMARVKAIKNTKPGGATGTVSARGRANPSYRGGSFNAYPVPQRLEEESKPTQHITMNIYNPLSEQNWAEIAENNIIPALNDASDRNVELTIKTVAA